LVTLCKVYFVNALVVSGSCLKQDELAYEVAAGTSVEAHFGMIIREPESGAQVDPTKKVRTEQVTVSQSDIRPSILLCAAEPPTLKYVSTGLNERKKKPLSEKSSMYGTAVKSPKVIISDDPTARQRG